MSGGVEGLFLVISHTFPIYKQLSTQGTITSCSLNKLDVKNHWVLWDLENPQALSSALAALRCYSPGPSSFLNPVEPWFLTSNYYICPLQACMHTIQHASLKWVIHLHNKLLACFMSAFVLIKPCEFQYFTLETM